MPINPESPTPLLPEVRRADDITTLDRSLRYLQIPHPGGANCNVVIPENQISAKGSAGLTWQAGDNQRRVYVPTASPLWDTGILFGQYLLSGGAGQLYAQVTVPDFYLVIFQLDSFTDAGTCNLSILFNDTSVFHERTSTITLGDEADHKAGIMTMAVFNAVNGDSFKVMGWHTGGGSCTAWITILQLY